MEYLKIARIGRFSSKENYFTENSRFDTHGLYAKLKASNGSLKLCEGVSKANEYYTLGEGDSLEFCGVVYYCGVAEAEYVLFEK